MGTDDSGTLMKTHGQTGGGKKEKVTCGGVSDGKIK